MNNQAFFYIDGIPTKGAWIDMDDITEWEQVKEQLANHLKIDAGNIDEILCSDIEGLPRHFYASNCDSFSMTEWADFKEQLEATHLDAEVIEAYLDNMGAYGGVDISDIEDAYYGEYDTFEDFVYQFVEDTCILEGMDDSVRGYFDYEKYGRDLSHDYFESNGHIFRNC
jgi:antirestriction protein